MEESYSGKFLSKSKKDVFIEAMLANISLVDIIEMFELDAVYAREVYVKLMYEYPEEVLLARAQRNPVFTNESPYYYKETEEMDIGKLPVYKFKELSKKEKIFYKMSKLRKFKIDVLLHMNAAIMTNLGTDSTKEEIAYIQKLKKEHNKKINEIDSEFYKTINDGEK